MSNRPIGEKLTYEEQREALDKAWEEFKAYIAQETPIKQILQFANWICQKSVRR